MEQIQIGDQVIRFDRPQTQQCYANIESGDADRCGCSHCRNFAGQRDNVYPEEFRRLLDLLGIDHKKEGEVYECGGDDLERQYGGWFYFTGELVKSGERRNDAGSGFSYFFQSAGHFPSSPTDFGESVAAIEFYTTVPWVLSEKPE